MNYWLNIGNWILRKKHYSITKLLKKITFGFWCPFVIWLYFCSMFETPSSNDTTLEVTTNECFFILQVNFFAYVLPYCRKQIWGNLSTLKSSHQRKHVDPKKRPYIYIYLGVWRDPPRIPVTIIGDSYEPLFCHRYMEGATPNIYLHKHGHFVSSVSSLRAIQVTWSYLASHATGPSRGIASWPFFMRSLPKSVLF